MNKARETIRAVKNGKEIKNKLCKCGCGQEVARPENKWVFKHSSDADECRRRMSKVHKNKQKTEKHKKRISASVLSFYAAKRLAEKNKVKSKQR